MRACLLALLAVPCVFAVRCYDYISTNDNRNTMKSWVDCPYEAQFCFKSYIEQHDMNNEKTWLASRSCGTPNLCTRDGCWGTRNDKTCCCRGELCNSSPAYAVWLLPISAVLYLVTAV
ncbi:hypothetical protein ANCCAN_19902 [Ancylostoma caninum]|uniref:UPAR/Ly6 domain-containing protein n=1 Tax=Ancylostoma caninum TaxID=29170 RepID=A0A368FQ34_ANCCA|nr:hypothetical protein ANCCAN_19902 [Ancylostoma caninum]